MNSRIMENYKEKQSTKLSWLIVPIAIMTLVPTLAFADSENGMIGVVIAGVTLLLIGGLLLSLGQTVQVDKIGIHFKQTPIHRTFRTVKWTEIKAWKVTKLNALSDFGGWGYRLTPSKVGYIIEGKYGLELKTKAKKLTVLSVKNKEEVERAMEYFGQET